MWITGGDTFVLFQFISIPEKTGTFLPSTASNLLSTGYQMFLSEVKVPSNEADHSLPVRLSPLGTSVTIWPWMMMMMSVEQSVE
jgi:hypothetical protein